MTTTPHSSSPKRTVVQFRVQAAEHRQLRIRAAEQGTTISALFRMKSAELLAPRTDTKTTPDAG